MVFLVEAVVGALLAAGAQGLFERTVPRKNVTEILMGKFKPDHKNKKNLFQNLMVVLQLVEKALSNDAVEKQLTSETNREWVERLTDAVNQIGDLLDEINYKVLAESQSSRSQSIDESALRKIIQNSTGELERMTKSLKDIAELKAVYGSKESSTKKKSSKLESTSLVKCEVLGRDKDEEKIRNFLMMDQSNEENIPIIAIIGMTGIGKTTLAQLLFNDSDVKNHFSPRAWVDVSDGMDVKTVTKTLYDKVTCRTSDTTNFDTLQCELAEKLKDKQFLLVFDDVCNEHHDTWDELQKVLKNGAPKSRIIVTTQSQEAALKMRAMQTHHLPPLNVKACWSVFAKKAFERPRSDAPPTSSDAALVPQDQEIWKRCGGLPLVARELGNLYYEVRAKEKEWEHILNGNLFDLSNDKSNIHTWFRLSFNRLSSPFVKQCFAYCSIIPKGYTFDKKKLILWWMAQGFLLQLKCGQTMEGVGNNYFEELSKNSFFQQASDDNKSLFKMHDLINELAQFASTVQSCLVEKGKSLNISDKTRHVSYVCNERHKEADLVDVLRKAQFLWTFLPLSFSSSIESNSIGTQVIERLQEQKQLRVLSLSYQEDKLPDRFGRLRHLRYLDLSDSLIKKLPKKISRFYALQTLILSRCVKLTELPKKMVNLINLGHLDLTETEALKMMPPEFGKLKSLQVLTTFVVSNNHKASSIGELGELLHLSGKLSILELQNVKDGKDAENAKLKEKKDVKELEFKWSSNGQHDKEEVLESLCPHEHIEKLSIEGYGGTRLPNWLGDSSFSKMVILHLSDCRNCSSLPSLGQLSSLQQLHVRDMPNCEQFLSSPDTGGGYLSLQELYVENCQELTAIPNNLTSLKLLFIKKCRQLKFDDLMGYLSLQELYVENCQELTAIPDNLTSLKLLSIKKCRQLKFDDFMVYLSLQELYVENCEELTAIPKNLTSLKLLSIKKCTQLKFDDFMGYLSLQELYVEDCEELTAIPKNLTSLKLLSIKKCRWLKFDDFMGYKKLQTLHIRSCNCLKALTLDFYRELEYLQIHDCRGLRILKILDLHQHLRFFKELEISECPSLKIICGSGLPAPKLTSFSVSNCNILRSMPGKMHTLLCSLLTLIIADCPRLVSFPNDGLPQSLQTLSIKNCVEFCKMPGEMHTHLSFLQTLEISDCPNLDSFPNEGLPLSLQTLIIENCDKLTPKTAWGLRNMTSLTHFKIDCACDNVTLFPDDDLLPASLTNLQIMNFKMLKRLNLKGLQHLTSLKELLIHCDQLEFLTDGSLPLSLCHLRIIGRPSLPDNCKRGGIYWDKISHISDKSINGNDLR